MAKIGGVGAGGWEDRVSGGGVGGCPPRGFPPTMHDARGADGGHSDVPSARPVCAATRTSLQLTESGGTVWFGELLTVVVPCSEATERIPTVLRAGRPWYTTRTHGRAQPQRQGLCVVPALLVPFSVELRGEEGGGRAAANRRAGPPPCGREREIVQCHIPRAAGGPPPMCLPAAAASGAAVAAPAAAAQRPRPRGGGTSPPRRRGGGGSRPLAGWGTLVNPAGGAGRLCAVAAAPRPLGWRVGMVGVAVAGYRRGGLACHRWAYATVRARAPAGQGKRPCATGAGGP